MHMQPTKLRFIANFTHPKTIVVGVAWQTCALLFRATIHYFQHMDMGSIETEAGLLFRLSIIIGKINYLCHYSLLHISFM